MDEKELKTSPKQRIFIIVIAVLMLGSVIAGYAAVILNGGKAGSSSGGSEISEEKIAEYEAAYLEKESELKEVTKDDFRKFIQYKSEIVAYNESSANSGGIQTKDLVVGTGEEITDENADYLAYYVGWCADESVFDSSFDDNDNPTAFTKILNASVGMIEGWNMGVKGMKLGGIREITIPGELAYGDSMEICGGYNKPLKFIVMTKANEDPLKTISDEIEEAYMRLQYAHYGIDYGDM
ncbi:FKBP-type peptidyl-prolyl cis-trans isomerase [Candidatus Saccharibacteria bacterium]|nr:FKBP-type peptidyl-prolyl cis-trans isomerase [Candidatus Saccharibacteria bacterium]